MSDTVNRGWLFMRGTTNVAGVTGNGTFLSRVSTGSHIAGNQGKVIIDGTASAGYNMLFRQKSTNGVFTAGAYSADWNLYYTADSTITAGTNSTTYSVRLINEAGNTRLNRLGINGENTSYRLYVNGTSLLAGLLRVNNAPIFGYRYGASNNAPAFVWDKAGSNFTGMGANGSADTIYFGAVSSDGNYNWVTGYKQKWVFNGTVTADSFIGNASSASKLNILRSISGNSHALALQNEFNANKASIPRNCLSTYYSSAYSNGSFYMGYFLSGYDTSPYGGFFVAHYGTPYYVGISNGSFTQSRLWKAGDAVTGAVWNDYAECRESDTQEAGYVLSETGKDSLVKTTERLQHFAGVSSDTWGFSQGETEKAKTPIAVAGRVLVYPYQDRDNYQPGDCVCAAPGGTVDIMTREEVIRYPDRIVGTVSCVPNYEEWGGGEGADRDPVKVNGRIWIKVR